MKRTLMTATELRQNLSQVIHEASNGTGVTILTYHGLGVAAIVPLSGPYAPAVSVALKEAEDASNMDDSH